jgi:hypothetical protein
MPGARDVDVLAAAGGEQHQHAEQKREPMHVTISVYVFCYPPHLGAPLSLRTSDSDLCPTLASHAMHPLFVPIGCDPHHSQP